MLSRQPFLLLFLAIIVLTSLTTGCQSNSIGQENDIGIEDPGDETQENEFQEDESQGDESQGDESQGDESQDEVGPNPTNQNWMDFYNVLYSFIYPSDWVVREAVFSDVPAIAVSTSEEAIASLENGNYEINSGQIVIAIYQLAEISEYNPFDIVADSAGGSNAVSTYAEELNNSGYTALSPEVIQFDNKTVYRSGAVLFGTEQLIYGWEQNIVYANTLAGEMESFQIIVETIIESINN